MTTAEDEFEGAGGRGSDSEKIERIAAYVRDQRKAERSWTELLGRFTVYLALAAFFFGIGTVSDLSHRFAASPPSAATASRAGYVESLDTYCKGFVGAPAGGNKGTGYARIAADDLAVLTARNRMNLAWNSFPVPKAMAPKDVAAFESIRSDYFAANDFLQAAVARARAHDTAGYALDIGLYRQTNATFLTAAATFGFTTCAHYWPVADAPKPA
jgi:hypothetical protein